MFNWIKQKLNVGRNRLPAPFSDATVANTRLLAIDLELTSLNPSSAQITSIGWVEGINNRILMDSCEYSIVKTKASLGQSPVIHGLTHEDIQQGKSVSEVISELYERLSSSILVFHNANLDLSVLNRVFINHGLAPVQVAYIDTLKLAVYQLKKRHQVLPDNSATLTVCRQRLGLPAVPAHNALDDALATLQLCFAQLSEFGLTQHSRYSDLLHTQGIGNRVLGQAV